MYCTWKNKKCLKSRTIISTLKNWLHICYYILFHAVRKFHNPPSFIRWIPRRVRASCIVLVERRNLFMEIISCLPDRASIMVIYICISFWLLAHVIYLKLRKKEVCIGKAEQIHKMTTIVTQNDTANIYRMVISNFICNPLST